MWGRLQAVYFTQAAFFAIAAYAASDCGIRSIWWALSITIMLQLYVLLLVQSDKFYRDKYGLFLTGEYKFDLLNYSGGTDYVANSSIQWWLLRFMYVAWIVIDVAVARHLVSNATCAN